eukprot:CAMPEP_0185726972 /NCGR_PEP_ID=MMETSP1171-20130828/2787_1 /TAXON_ID=374046 /ORGANISM="Helicotheca tamensis, Strain CCMP826" /LENGTH=319 /DNA_ID=CAMNT_0028395423 /DNA_START=73 /DNA_END=1032 /DNA_ORIENTATION=+
MRALNRCLCVILSVIASSTVESYTDHAIFRQNFETDDLWAFDDLIRIQDYYSGGAPYGHILRASYPPDPTGSPRITEEFNLDEVATSATLSFDVKLHSQFEFVKGGKMHGLGGGTTTTGCDPIEPDGWSVRLMWKTDGVPLVYVYHQRRVETCGDGFYPESDFKFQRGQWYRIDLQVKMNSAPNVEDGKTVLYIDGEKLVEVNGLELSGDSLVQIDKFMFSTFYGGSSQSWSPSKKTYIYYDNFNVYKSLRVTGSKATDCEIFRGGIYDPSKEVCCANSCGSCGGSGCGSLPGGGSQCCTGPIIGDNNLCDNVDAPCMF